MGKRKRESKDSDDQTNKKQRKSIGETLSLIRDDIIYFLEWGLPLFIYKCTFTELPLHRAVKEDRIDVIKYLIEKGIDVDARNKQGKSPALLAFEHANYEIVEYLLKCGARLPEDQLSHYLAVKADVEGVSEVECLLEDEKLENEEDYLEDEKYGVEEHVSLPAPNHSIVQFLATRSRNGRKLTKSDGDLFWVLEAKKNGVPFIKGRTPELTPKEEFQLYLDQCNTPPEFISIFGSQKEIDQLPIVNYKESHVYPHETFERTITPNDLMGHKIMRGVGVTYSDNGYQYRSFIAFCVKKINTTFHDELPEVDVYVLYMDDDHLNIYFDGCNLGLSSRNSLWKNRYIEYFKKLIDNESCESLIRHHDNPNADENIMVQLTKQFEICERLRM